MSDYSTKTSKLYDIVANSSGADHGNVHNAEFGVTWDYISQLRAQGWIVDIIKTYDNTAMVQAKQEAFRQDLQMDAWIKEKELLTPYARKLQVANKALEAAQQGAASGPLDTQTGAIIPWNSILIDKVHGVADVDKDFYISERHVAFSPLENGFSLENGIMLLMALLIGRKDPKALERIITKYLDVCGGIVGDIQQACHSNWLTALDNQFITVAIAHRIGLIDDGAYLKIYSHYDDVTNKMINSEFIGNTMQGITTLITGGSYSTRSASGVTEETKGLLGAILGKIKD
jgi:hypothetical protein